MNESENQPQLGEAPSGELRQDFPEPATAHLVTSSVAELERIAQMDPAERVAAAEALEAQLRATLDSLGTA